MLAPRDNPPVCSPLLQLEEGSNHHWWIAHTRSRAEKAFAWDMVNRDIAYFLPMVERMTFSGGRKRRVMLPLFPSYVFISGDQQAYHAALTTQRVCRLMKVVDHDTLTRELLAIELALQNKLALDPYPFAAVGRRCRISGGPLRGIEGVVVQRGEGSFRLVLEVRMLGQGASVEIEIDLLEPVDAIQASSIR